jgi:hypothetical protein
MTAFLDAATMRAVSSRIPVSRFWDGTEAVAPRTDEDESSMKQMSGTSNRTTSTLLAT